MNRISLIASGVLILTLLFFTIHRSTNLHHPNPQSPNHHSPEPSDYLWAQRAYPYGEVPSAVQVRSTLN